MIHIYVVTFDNVLSLILCAFEHIVWKMRFINKLKLLLLLLLLLLSFHLPITIGKILEMYDFLLRNDRHIIHPKFDLTGT